VADIATLGLELDGRRLRSEADRSTQSLNRMERAGTSLRSAMLQLGISISAGLVFRKIVENTKAAQYAMAQLEAVVKSTGGAAGKTVEELDAMAKALQQTTIYGDEATKSAQGILLTFKAVKGEAFDGAVKATLDLATAMGTDLKSAALQVGKALEDPATQMTYLRRSGVSFTKEQIELAKQLQETGRLAEAQAMVLKELDAQFGGSAEAARDTLGGALAYLSNQWNDLFEISKDGSDGLVSAINAIGDAIPGVRDKINDIVVWFEVWGSQVAVTGAQIELLLAKMKFWDKDGIRKAEESLNRMLVAMNDVITPLEYGSNATETLTSNMASLSDQAGMSEEAIKKFNDELERLLDLELKFGTGRQIRASMGPRNWAPAGPTLGTGAVTPNLSIAAGAQAYADYEAYIKRVTDALDESGPEWDAVLRGVASLTDGLGILDDVAQTAVRAVSDIVSGLRDIGGGGIGAIGGFMGIGGAVAGVIGGIWNMAGEADAAAAAFAAARVRFITELREWRDELASVGASNQEQMARELQQRLRTFMVDWVNAFWASFTNAQRRAITPIPEYDQSLDEWIAWMESLLDLLPEGTQAWRDLRDMLETAKLAVDDMNASLRELAATATEDLWARAFSALGNTDFALTLRQARERDELSAMGVDVDLIDAVHGIEREVEANNRWAQQQATAVQEQAEKQLAKIDKQIDLQESQLSTLRDQLREQERTVDSLTRVIENLGEFSDSLLLGNQTVLGPYGQLDEARKQFEAMAALAQGGDVTAAQSLPEAARAFLGASRTVNMSSTAYVEDFQRVQAVVSAVRGQFAGQLTTEEQTLGTLREQVEATERTIRLLRDQRKAVQQAAEAQIAAIQATVDAANERAMEQLQAIYDSAEINKAGFRAIVKGLQEVRAAIIGESKRLNRNLEGAGVGG